MGEMKESLENDGLVVLNNETDKYNKNSTIIILGVARSGTSMITSVLDRLGVFLGSKAKGAVKEDAELFSAMEMGDDAKVEQIIARYNEQHAVWAFKRPEAFTYIKKYLPYLRNPKIVVIFRDPVAIARRNEISMYSDFMGQLERSTKKLLELTHFVNSQKNPVLFVSYEKALYRPDHFVKVLSDFCGLDLDEKTQEIAIKEIDNGPVQYLRESRLSLQGRFDRVVDGCAYGWVRLMPGNAVCEVEITCDGEILGTARADKPRADLEQKKIGPRAFAIKLAKVPEGGKLKARVKGMAFEIPKTDRFQQRP